MQLFCPLRLSAPSPRIKASRGIIAGMCGKEIVGVGLMENGNMAALLIRDLRGKEGNGECVLVIIRDQPALNGVADCLPPLVVLIENVASFYGCVLINDQQSPTVKGQFLSARLITIQETADGIA